MAKKKEVLDTGRKVNQEALNELLIQNFVSLQSAVTHMAEKLDDTNTKLNTLSDHLSKLLHLFEISARSFMESPAVAETEKDKEFLDKLNTLMDQNKTIAKGLTLMESKLRERLYGEQNDNMPQRLSQGIASSNQEMNPSLKKLPRFQ